MKNFGELKKGDYIYFYSKDIWKGPGNIKTFCLEEDPVDSISIKDNVWISVRFDENNPNTKCELEFYKHDYAETIDLEDFDFNYMKYGSEEFVFTTDLNEINLIRKNEIEKLISLHEQSIKKLKEMIWNSN